MNENQNVVEEVLKLFEANILKVGKITSDLALLEFERQNKKTEVNKILILMEKNFDEFNVKDFDNDSKGKLLDLWERLKPPFNNSSISQKIRWNRAFNEHQEIKDWKLMVYFDFPKPLKIYICYPDLSSKVVDIIESIKKDINNIGHPLILKAIERYRMNASSNNPTKGRKFLPNKFELHLNSDTAHFCLEEISKALKKSNFRKTSLKQLINFHKSKDIYDSDYFEKILELLKSDVVKKSHTISNKKMYLRLGLKKAFPNVEHKEILSWLESRLRSNLMPQRWDEKTLKNDFWSWKLGVKRNSAKTYLSNQKKFAEKMQGITFTEEERKKWVQDGMFSFSGIVEMPAYHNISALVIDKKAFDSLDKP